MTVRTMDTFYRLTPWKSWILLYTWTLLFTLTHTATVLYFFKNMENTNDNNKNSTEDNNNTERVEVDVDGNKKVFYFPSNPTSAVVIDESSETETEEEEKEAEQDHNKQRKQISEPTPARADRAHDYRAHSVTSLKPAATMTPALKPSDLFPAPQLPAMNSKLQLEIEINIALETTSPVLESVEVYLSPQTSPLPVLDLTMDIMGCLETEATRNISAEALEACFLDELPDFTDSDIESMMSAWHMY